MTDTRDRLGAWRPRQQAWAALAALGIFLTACSGTAAPLPVTPLSNASTPSSGAAGVAPVASLSAPLGSGPAISASASRAASAAASSALGSTTSGPGAGGTLIAQAPPSPPGNSSSDWPTYHRDLARTGRVPAAFDATVAQQVWQSPTLDGAIYAEPLAVGNRLFVATEGDTVYGLDLPSHSVVWNTPLGTPVPSSALPCGNIDPTGITSTPVIDSAAGILYTVAFLQPAHHELVALDINSGNILYRTPIDPPGSNPITQQQRSALTLSNGLVYVGFGGLFGDCGRYHGWLVAANASDGSFQSVYQVPSDNEGAIWASSGPSVGPDGSIYVATGNAGTTSFDYGDAAIKLSPNLNVLDYFAPSDWAQNSAQDLDLGSTSPQLLDNNVIFQIGKAGLGYLLDASQLGGIGGQAFVSRVCNSAFGGNAYASPYLYVPCSTGLVALQMSGTSFSTIWHGPQGDADPPIVAGDTVWTVEQGSGTLYALGAADGSVRFQAQLANSGNSLPHFITPTVAGSVVIVSQGNSLVAFGAAQGQ